MKLLPYLFISAIAATVVAAMAYFLPNSWFWARVNLIPVRVAFCAVVFIGVVNLAIYVFDHYHDPKAKKMTKRAMMAILGLGSTITIVPWVRTQVDRFEVFGEIHDARLQGRDERVKQLRVTLAKADAESGWISLYLFLGTAGSTFLFAVLYAGVEYLDDYKKMNGM